VSHKGVPRRNSGAPARNSEIPLRQSLRSSPEFSRNSLLSNKQPSFLRIKGHGFRSLQTEFMRPEVKNKKKNLEWIAHASPLNPMSFCSLWIVYHSPTARFANLVGGFPGEIVWKAQQIGKPYLCSNPTNTKTQPKQCINSWD
jgi:hypothetical protein